MEIRVYMDALEVIEKEIKGITKKESITPAELANLKEALCAAEKIIDIVGELPNDANDYSNGTGYAQSYAIRPGFKHEYYDMPYSYRRGRSPVTGRYISRGEAGRNYGDVYSGHSIHDRMVAKIEEMYDDAKTDHERQVIDNAIRMIEQHA